MNAYLIPALALLIAYALAIVAHYLLIKTENKRAAYDILQRSQELNFHEQKSYWTKELDAARGREDTLRSQINLRDNPPPLMAELVADVPPHLSDMLAEANAERTVVLSFASPEGARKYRDIVNNTWARAVQS